jgi:hypothetical protein
VSTVDRRGERPLTRQECGELGAMARLKTESWDAMTAAARSSPEHVSSMDRWLRKARESNPNLSDEQAGRLADKLRTEHYREMGRRSVQARRAARS